MLLIGQKTQNMRIVEKVLGVGREKICEMGSCPKHL